MNASQILDKVRTRYADDPLCEGDDVNSLWSNDEIYDAIDEAQKAFAFDTRLLRDSRTTSVTQLTVTADSEWADVSDKVLEIKKAKLSSNGAKLSIIDYQKLENGFLNIDDYFNFTSSANWESDTGTPIAIILNLQHDAVRLYPIPESNDTIELTVVRLPTSEVNSATKNDDLDFSDLWKNAMTFGALRELYMKQDSDEVAGVDSERVRTFDALYQREVEKAVRHRIRTQKSTTSSKTRYGGIP